MSSGLHRPAQYVHYTGPAQTHNQGQQNVGHGQQQQPTTVSPQDTQHAPPKTHTSTHTHASNLTATVPRAAAAVHNAGTSVASTSNNNAGASAQGQGQAPAPQPVVAKGNWTKDLVQLAKTAELKKHALTLQLHTAHILSAHASLEQKNRAIQDIREQRNKLESERQRLIECLAQVNEDRNQADLLEATLDRERGALRAKIGALSEGEYKAAKADVDRLRADLGQPPLPTLQETLDGKGAGYLAERRTAGTAPSTSNLNPTMGVNMGVGQNVNPGMPQGQGAPVEKKRKRAGNGANGTGANGAGTNGTGEAANGEDGGQAKRPRGRPRGSRNRGGAPGG